MNTVHPVFLRFKKYKGMVAGGYSPEFTGAMISIKFAADWDMPDRRQDRYVETEYPAANDEIFEYISFLNSICEAKNNFTMIELGAGYGRWLVSAAKATEQIENLTFFLIGVEAEPSHFQMMQEHFKNNGIDPEKHILMEAAVSDHDGRVFFRTGSPHECWGQSIADPVKWWNKPFFRARRNTEKFEVKSVRSVSLKTILNRLQIVDLIDMDVQGEEYKVLKHSTSEIDKKVKRIHIGTHGRDIEKDIRSLFVNIDWNCEYDFSGNSTSDTPFGKVSFQDGVQVWKNKKL
jgi:FkbM family methyltransferase